MKTIAFDIETVPNDRAAAYIKGFLDKKEYRAPGQYKDPLKIEAYKDAARAAEQKNYTEKAGLYWWTGKVCCISVAADSTVGEVATSFVGSDEKKILCEFFNYLTEFERLGEPLQVVGFNSKSFDVPFVRGRAMYHNIGLPLCLTHGKRPVTDVFEIFNTSIKSRNEQRNTLATYAFGLGIQGKTGSGADVAAMYEKIIKGEAKWDDLSDYCEQDALIVYKIMDRYNKRYQIT